MQENPLSVFFQMRKYFTKFLLICEIFFDFYKQEFKKTKKTLHVAKFVKLLFTNMQNFSRKFFVPCNIFQEFLKSKCKN